MKPITEKVKLLLVDDHAIVRAGFRHLLKSDADYEIKEVDSAEEACKVYGDYQPDAVIMDLMMPGMGGLEGVRYLHAKDKKAKIPVASTGSVPFGTTIDTTQTTIPLDDTSSYSSSGGYVRIDDEIIEYTSKTDTELTGCIRGRFQTTQAEHDEEELIGLCHKQQERYQYHP